jgi:septal ring factor EnvC (AmiA/AmiB activator)
MPGPRIYTEAWERLKVAAKETEAREAEGPRPETRAPGKPERRRGSKLLVIAMAVLGLLAVLTTGLWIDSQTRLMIAARDVADFRTRLELLQDKMRKMEEERQRVSDENGTLSLQYEQTTAEVTRLEEEIETLRSQKEKPKPKGQPVAALETPLDKAQGAPGAFQEPPLRAMREGQGDASKLQTSEQRRVKAHMID